MNQKDMQEMFRVLGESNRFKIFKLLSSSKELCVCKIYEALKLPQNLASHHLAVMKKNNMVSARKEGRWIYYSLNKKTLDKLLQFFSTI